MDIYHSHHIIPKHFGGTDDPNNLIKLTPVEHAAWHYESWCYYGSMHDWYAWQGLLGLVSKHDIVQASMKIGQINGGKWHKGRLKSLETKKKMAASALVLWEKRRKLKTTLN